MELLASVEKFLLIFFLFGHSCFYPKTEKLKKRSNLAICHIIPVALFGLNVISACALLYFNEVTSLKVQERDALENASQMALTYIKLACHTLVNTIIIVQAMHQRKNIQQLFFKIQQIARNSKQKLGHDMCFMRFRRDFLRKVMLTVVFFAMNVGIRFITPSLRLYRVVQPSLMLYQWNTNIGCLHATFYTNLLGSIMKSINENVDSEQCHCHYCCSHVVNVLVFGDVNNAINKLKRYKFMHYKLWETSQLINQQFGCSLVAMMIIYFMEMSYSCYWIYLYMQPFAVDAPYFRFSNIARK